MLCTLDEQSHACRADATPRSSTAEKKSALNPFAKSFSFNPMAKEFTPSGGALTEVPACPVKASLPPSVAGLLVSLYQYAAAGLMAASPCLPMPLCCMGQDHVSLCHISHMLHLIGACSSHGELLSLVVV